MKGHSVANIPTHAEAVDLFARMIALAPLGDVWSWQFNPEDIPWENEDDDSIEAFKREFRRTQRLMELRMLVSRSSGRTARRLAETIGWRKLVLELDQAYHASADAKEGFRSFRRASGIHIVAWENFINVLESSLVNIGSYRDKLGHALAQKWQVPGFEDKDAPYFSRVLEAIEKKCGQTIPRHGEVIEILNKYFWEEGTPGWQSLLTLRGKVVHGENPAFDLPERLDVAVEQDDCGRPILRLIEVPVEFDFDGTVSLCQTIWNSAVKGTYSLQAIGAL